MNSQERKIVMRTRKFKSVHDAHCCPNHGCKYGDEDCPVVLGKEMGIYCEVCEYNERDPMQQAQRKLILSVIEALAALKSGYPQIHGALVVEDFDRAIQSCTEVLEKVQGKIHETNTDNPVDFPKSR